MLTALGLGLLLGMRHALDPDHLIAVTALGAQRAGDARSFVRHSLAWGAGHAATLCAVALVVIATRQALSPGMERALSVAAAVALVVAGVWAVLAAARGAPQSSDAASARGRDVGRPVPVGRSLFIGLAQGLAGSAALMVLAAAQLREGWPALLYVVLYAMGSIGGMALLAVLLGRPLALVATQSARMFRVLSFGAGALAIVLGATSAVWAAAG